MKLCCNKCKRILTSDIRPVKEYKAYDNGVGNDHGYSRVKKGVFFSVKKSVYYHKFEYHGIDGYNEIFHTKSSIVVSDKSIVDGVIPVFYKGGCCNHSMGKPLICDCKNVLGKMHLDCYEDGSVHFYTKSVDRVYK